MTTRVLSAGGFQRGGAKDWSQYGHDGVVRNGAKIVYDAERGMVLLTKERLS
jgi:hypothetical protein